MAIPLASVRRYFGRDVRRALVATPLRRFLAYGQWIVVFTSAVVFSESAPWWVSPLVAIVEVVALVWIGNRLADRDALAADRAET